jgi:hypothetical protein
MKLCEVLSSFEMDGADTRHDMPPSHGDVPGNPEDTLTLDIPLFIRLLEYAKEEAASDMDLHKITENALKLHSEKLTMDDYDSIVIKHGDNAEEHPSGHLAHVSHMTH